MARHQVMAAAGGSRHSAAVGEDGSLFVCGGGSYGQLGTGNTGSRRTLTSVSGLPGPVRQVAAGRHNMGIVTDAGDLLMCGCGQYGLLGVGDEGQRTRPTLVERALFDDDAVLMVACGRDHTAAVTEGGGVFTFGLGSDGRLGYGNGRMELAPRRVPAAEFNDEQMVMVAAGISHTVALSKEGHVFTWGWGYYGQLGHGDREPQRRPRQLDPGLFGGEKVVFVTSGGIHTVALTSGGRLYTWGGGVWGQLGHGDTDSRLVPTLVDAGAFGGSAGVMVACGNGHNLVVTQDGALWVCGAGHHGQLGLGDWQSRHAFERVEMGAFGGARIVAAAAGSQHSAAVTKDGALWTWGAGDDGQLGHGDGGHRRVPTMVEDFQFGGRRFGRCRALPAEHALAFAMGTHGRLGGGQEEAAAAGGAMLSSRLQNKAASPCFSLKEELVGLIVRLSASVTWPAGRAGEVEGVVRLLGGGARAGGAMRAWPAMAIQAAAGGQGGAVHGGGMRNSA